MQAGYAFRQYILFHHERSLETALFCRRMLETTKETKYVCKDRPFPDQNSENYKLIIEAFILYPIKVLEKN